MVNVGSKYAIWLTITLLSSPDIGSFFGWYIAVEVAAIVGFISMCYVPTLSGGPNTMRAASLKVTNAISHSAHVGSTSVSVQNRYS
jgi:hypothetical protein